MDGQRLVEGEWADREGMRGAGWVSCWSESKHYFVGFVRCTTTDLPNSYSYTTSSATLSTHDGSKRSSLPLAGVAIPFG